MILPLVAILCISVLDFDAYKNEVDTAFQANRGKRPYARECARCQGELPHDGTMPPIPDPIQSDVVTNKTANQQYVSIVPGAPSLNEIATVRLFMIPD
ncbi:MAG: hypothetical protein VYA69_07345 [Gemmatimonadota bacterium]|nr:hypothetical protein [Gemmatimonadota bacterium]